MANSIRNMLQHTLKTKLKTGKALIKYEKD